MFFRASMKSIVRACHQSLKRASMKSIVRACHQSLKRNSLKWYGSVYNEPLISSLSKSSSISTSLHYQLRYNAVSAPCGDIAKWLHVRAVRNASVELEEDGESVRFSLNKRRESNGLPMEKKSGNKRVKKSKKAVRNELRFYRLKAKKKMNSPNPEVRIRYKLEKAKRKEAWLIEKLRKFELSKAPAEAYDPEILTVEEKHYLKRTGEKKKNYVQVGRRGVFGGVVLNMHLHWKNHETVKVVCKPCKPGKIHEYAEELARLSKGIAIDIKPSNTIIFYRGKNYVQPEIISPPDTLSKNRALEKYKYEQSLEHTGWFVEKLENELEEYYEHVTRYKTGKEDVQDDSLNLCSRKRRIMEENRKHNEKGSFS